jgi:hypothetical protein
MACKLALAGIVMRRLASSDGERQRTAPHLALDSSEIDQGAGKHDLATSGFALVLICQWVLPQNLVDDPVGLASVAELPMTKRVSSYWLPEKPGLVRPLDSSGTLKLNSNSDHQTNPTTRSRLWGMCGVLAHPGEPCLSFSHESVGV